jgi:hypothetical protein
MYKWLTSHLRRIVGRLIKMAKSDYFMAVSSLGIPIGVTILIVNQNDLSTIDKITSMGLILFGMISWFAAIFSLKIEEKVDNLKSVRLEILLKDIKDEIKGLRHDVRGNNNARDNEPKPKM